MRYKNKGLSLLSVAAVGTLAVSSVNAATLDDVESNGEIRCGVNAGLTGFSAPDENGNWAGIDADFCRAVAAAALGDAESVAFTPLTAKERFTALQSGEIDVLSRNTTWTATRDNSLGLDFTGVTFYDGQAFMVSKDLGVSSLDELNGATICIQSGTTHELNIADYFPANDLDYQLVTFDTPDQTAQGFGSGRCDVLTSDSSQLAALRLQLDDPEGAMILPERISKEPLGPVVRQDDSQWFDIVKWTLFAMINAEEMGVTQDNVDDMRDNPPNPNVARLLGQDGNYGEQMGIGSDWAYNIIKQVGNYGEVYERNVGADSPLEIDRGINALWSDGGIQYAPPVR